MSQIDKLVKISSQIRRDIIRMVYDCQSGHPGGSLGCADIFTALFFEVMDHNPHFHMTAKEEDVFYLSNGHISPVYYSALARSGYFPVEELSSFRKINSRLQGHPATHEGLPGIRVASGSLGQGLSVAAGHAYAKKIDGDDKTVFVLMGDGELQEGQIWEAAMFSAHHKLDNLIGMVDWNGQQIDGPNSEVCDLGDLRGKWESFGWDVMEVEGNDMEALLKGFEKAKSNKGNGKPVLMLIKTEMGYGVDFMTGTHAWHGKAPNTEQYEIAINQLPQTLEDY